MGNTVSSPTLNTVFTPPTACGTNDVLTKTASDTDLWWNIIEPAASITATSCYPPQFWSSAIATSSYGPFAQLICPTTWNTYPINSTYIICCPGGYALNAPNLTNTQRPAISAWCWSSIASGILYDVISYDSTGIQTTLGLTGTGYGTLAWATPFDGVQATTTISSATSSSSASRTSISSTTSKTSTTARVSGGLSTISASIPTSSSAA